MNYIDANLIGQRIRDLRKAKGLTQEEFAEEIGRTVSFVSKMEVGSRLPSIDTFVELSDYFGVTLDYLVLGIERS